jgi:hypothetical protein
MDQPAEHSSAGAIVLFIIIAGILALVSFISGWPWNYLG